MILVGLLIGWHFYEKGCSKQTFTKVKTWMLITLFCFIGTVFVRYTSQTLGNAIYTIILIFNTMLGSINYFLVCYYYVSQGLRKGSGKKVIIEKALKIIGIIAICLFVFMFIYVPL